MPFDVAEALRARHGENYELHDKHLNHQLARVLKTIGFDRFYVRGEGSYLFDAEGERYLDFLSGFGVYALGRSHPALKAALHQAIDLDLPNMVQMDCALLPGLLAEQLVARCGEEINRVFFCNSGAEAIESAIKFSRQATRRPRILFADHAFHGLSTGALSLNGGDDFRRGLRRAAPRTAARCRSATSRRCAASSRRGDVAAFIVEPIQGKGVYMASPEYWQEAQELCRRHKTLLVLDEVQTGLGRTGKFFCFEHWDLEARHHHRLQGAVRRLRPGRRHADHRPRLLVGLQLAREGDEALDHLRAQPAGHGGRTGHAGHLRRRGHRRAGPRHR